MERKYNRILIKISGEALMNEQRYVHDIDIISQICDDVKKVQSLGYQVCVVIGGGNICRGATAATMGIERASADYMGMLATVINAIALQSKLENLGVFTRVQSAIPMMTVAEPYIRRRAIRHMEKNRVVIFAAGTGSPFFTTDTAAVLRATEMNCDVILKGTNVDGVYSADPKLDKNAVKQQTLTYKDVILNDLGVMDTTAITLAMDNKMPILVFDIHSPGEIVKVLDQTGKYSIIHGY